MMATTEHRPVPLPNRPGAQPAGGGRPNRPLPAGAKAWSKAYLDEQGVPARSEHPVPIDEDGRRTPHVRYTCPHKERIKDGTSNMARVGCAVLQWVAQDAPAPFCPDHGERLESEQAAAPRDPLIPWGEVWRTLERPLRPAWALAAELAAGVAAHQLHLPVVDALMAAGVLAGGGYVGVRMHLTRREQRSGRLDKGQREGRNWRTILRRARGAAYLGLAAGGWLTWFSDVDPHSPFGLAALVALPVAWAVGSQPWRRYVTAERNRPAKQVPAGQPVEGERHGPGAPTADQAEAAETAQQWDADSGIANTRLDVNSWKKTEFGWQAVIVATKRGALNNLGGEATISTVKKVASTYDVPTSAVTWLEEYEENPNRALVLVQPNNPLKDGEIWGGPDTVDIVKGVALVGRYIDGTPMMETLYKYGWGAPSSIDLGITGGGKSEGVRKRLAIERWASFIDPSTGQRKGAFISILHDPKRMQSYADFKKAVHAYGVTRDDAHIIIDALLRECFRRYDMMTALPIRDRKGRDREGVADWNPLVHGPIISVYWDEFHELTGDTEFVAKLEKLARYQRACAMRAKLLSHMGTLGDTGSQALRDALAGGRATLYRTTSALNKVLVTGGQLTGDPRTLPKDPGMCYVADGESQTLIGRESWIPRDDEKFDVTLYDWLFDDNNQPIGYPAEIPPETAEAFGREFMEWAEAGRQPGGRPLPTVEETMRSDNTLQAQQVLRRILFRLNKPTKRIAILEDAEWTYSGSTLTNVLRQGQDANPPWLVRHRIGQGLYELTAAMRQQMAEAVRESSEDAA